MNIKINKTPSGTVRYPHHSHRQYEIMHYVSGEGNMWTEGGNIPFSAGTVIIVPPGISHGSVSEKEFCNISLEYDFGGLLALSSPISLSGGEANDGDRLAMMIWENRCASDAYLRSLCSAYVQYLLQRIEIESGRADCIRKIVMQISDDAFNPEINVSEILQRSGYAEDYVRSLFKRHTGKTPLEFLNGLRMKHACYLIDVYKDTLSLFEIAEKCGYFDYAYFSKKFKKYTGLSPRSYKEQ